MPQRNDEPVLLDGLNRWDLIREIGDELATCDPPHVFGIHGDWGLGKTSVLHQTQLYLTGRCPVFDDEHVKEVSDQLGLGDYGQHGQTLAVVWFEAWRYQHEPAPVVALLHEIRSQLAWHVKIVRRTKKLADVAARSAIMNLDSITKLIGVQASKVREEGERWEKENLAEVLPSNVLREQLQAAVDGMLKPIVKGKTRRLVVMIDDLDRCNPAGAYRLLEGLKIYLTLPNCVFLLGMNQRIMEDAIGEHVPINDKGPAAETKRAERAAAYLEKLCQNVWRLPIVDDPKTYLLKLLPDDKPVVRQWLDKAIKDFRCLPPNPRRLKGLANLLVRFANYLPQSTGTGDEPEMIQDARRMLIVAYVYQFHHNLFRLWESDPEVHRYLLRWCRNTLPPKSDDGDEEEAVLFKVLRNLRRAVLIQPDLEASEPAYTVTSAFPDPTDTSVFWIQRLIHEAAVFDEAEDESPALWATFERYLHAQRGAQGGNQ